MHSLYPYPFEKNSLNRNLYFIQQLRGENTPVPPALDQSVENIVLESGHFTFGPYAGQGYDIVVLHPQNAKAAHALSEIGIEHERRQGKQNLLPRSYQDIRNMMQLDMRTDHERGGLLVGLVSQNKLLAMGGVALIADPKDGGRGQKFSRCPANKQVVLKMAVTHPGAQGQKLTSLIFPHRLNIATKFNRDYVVTKVAGQDTKNFYKNKMGFLPDGEELFLPEATAPDNYLATLGQNMADITRFLQSQYPHLAASGFDPYALPDAYKLCLQAA